MEAAPQQAKFDQKRKAEVKEHMVNEAKKRRVIVERRAERRAKLSAKMSEVVTVVDFSALSLKELREQMQYWKHASVSWAGLRMGRWRDLLKDFKLGTAPAQKYEADYAAELVRYQDALDFFISNKRNEAFTPPVNSFDTWKVQASPTHS